MMKIIVVDSEPNVYFGDIPIGHAFRYNKVVYICISSTVAIIATTGYRVTFNPDMQVTPAKKMTIEF